MGKHQDLTEAIVPLIQEAARMAGGLRIDLDIQKKKDLSLVTNVDKAIERFLKPELLALTPGAGFYGEEFGHTPATDAGYWVVDPVDGTSNFAFGQPLWGITAAFLEGGVIVSAVTMLPDLGELYTASLGGGAFVNGEQLGMIPDGDIEHHHLLGNTDSSVRYLAQTPGKMRHIGAFVVESTFAATQRYRALMTSYVSLYDCAAGVLINRECGADVRYLTGEPFDESRHLGPERCDPFFMGPKNSNFPFGKLSD